MESLMFGLPILIMGIFYLKWGLETKARAKRNIEWAKSMRDNFPWLIVDGDKGNRK